MSKETVIILIIVALTLFVWVPAIIFSVRRVLKSEKKKQDGKDC
jgi:flagellar basal body-associated protein FliL